MGTEVYLVSKVGSMGFRKWLARRGVVGGTARWAANGYKFFRQRHPDESQFPEVAVYRLLITDRYKIVRNDGIEQYLLARATEFRGLQDLVAELLDQETGFWDNSHDNVVMFMDVIEEELAKKGLPNRVIR